MAKALERMHQNNMMIKQKNQINQMCSQEEKLFSIEYLAILLEIGTTKSS